ncbi:AGPLU2 protein [Ostreococcus tauri]|nr:AGPLU2 protein [Ostreococcus tauri]
MKMLSSHSRAREARTRLSERRIARGRDARARVVTRMDASAAEAPMRSPNAIANTKTVAAVILGGGAGTRLYPLTKSRAKPAVPIGGAYRLIDVPMSNCLNSGISKVYILTQFNSASLNRHLARTYNFGNGIMYGGNGFVEVLAATQTPGQGGKEWFQGTADAVRQYSWLFNDVKNKDVEDIVILAGDHLYRMDYMKFVEAHRESNADISVGTLPIDEARASDFGLMKIDSTGRIVEFTEKPKGDALQAMKVDTTVLGLTADEAKEKPFIASMGIYVFKKSALVKFLEKDYPEDNDFGGEIIPRAAADGAKVQAYLFNDYWEDIGTMKSFFEANLNLAKDPPNFEFYNAEAPIYTSPRFLPPAKVERCHVKESIISHGASLADCQVEESIIGLRSVVNKGCRIKRAMIIGADFYESDEKKASLLASGEVPVGIGEGTIIENAIIDKNARVGKNCVITNAAGVEDLADEERGVFIRNGIITILRNCTIPDGTII